MKPNVGMNYPVAAAISAYTPGSAITYGTGFVVSEARGANLQWETENGEFYGDDVLLDAAKGIIGYTLDFEAAGLSDTVREKLLGEVKSSDEYSITGADAPDVGFGYIRVMRDNASGSVVENYEGWWFHKIKFGQPNEEARTKERSIEWRTPTITKCPFFHSRRNVVVAVGVFALYGYKKTAIFRLTAVDTYGCEFFIK